LDQRLIHRGKKRPFGRDQDDLRWRNPQRPNDSASVGLAERIGPPQRLPHRFPVKAVRAAVARVESVGPFGQPQFGGRRCPEPLAKTLRESYNVRDLDLALRLPLLAGFFGEFTSFYEKSVKTTTLFVKRTTKEVASLPNPEAPRRISSENHFHTLVPE
jgi:hypothetical protein